MPTLATLPAADLLIFVDEAQALGASGREIRNACRRGELVRVRRGAYCPREDWERADERMRHLMAIRAVVRRMRGPFLVGGPSAAAVWGLPFCAKGRDDVTLLVPYHGGGTSEPGVRRTCASYVSARPHDIDGIPVTGLARTVLDASRRLGFSAAVAVADYARSRRRAEPIPREDLLEELSRAGFARDVRHLGRVIEFSTSLSDTVGESQARCAIHLAGFEVPSLQERFQDAEGFMESDFFWKSVNKAGEFDGKVKYTRDEYTSGDPSAVVWREKRREDRLRRLVDGVVRLVSDEIHDPATLSRILSDAGVPRRRP